MAQQVDLSPLPVAFARGGEWSIRSASPDALPTQYGLLAEAMMQAHSDHIITALPDSKPASTSDYSRSRLKTIHNRLFMLGYLEEDHDGVVALDARLRAAIEYFQQEAFGTIRLTADGWVGEQTWAALQQLVSFEESSHLNSWFDRGGKPCPALLRAVHLRLYALGMTGTHPTRQLNAAGIDEALQRFSEVIERLQLVDQPLAPTPTVKTLGLLFDQDGLVARLATAHAPKGYKERLRIKPFIISMTKVELWLAGYDICPDGYADEEDTTFTKLNALDLSRDIDLTKALTAYWGHLGAHGKRNLGRSSPGLKARALVNSAFPDFFLSVHERLKRSAEEPLADSDAVYSRLEKEIKKDPTVLQQVWNYIYDFGARIWDGIKRAWHWLKARITDLVSTTEAYLKNLSRLAYHYIRRAYEAVSAVIKGVAGSISFFTPCVLNIPKEKLKLNKGNCTLIGHDMDFDFRVLVDVKDSAADVQRIVDYVNGKSTLFGISCKLLALLLELLKQATFAGWPMLLMALLKLYRAIVQWAPVFLDAQRREAALLTP
ncbi:MAG: peptidoglycan-binding domain-containing protein [Mariprofundus sp.]